MTERPKHKIYICIFHVRATLGGIEPITEKSCAYYLHSMEWPPDGTSDKQSYLRDPRNQTEINTESLSFNITSNNSTNYEW